MNARLLEVAHEERVVTLFLGHEGVLYGGERTAKLLNGVDVPCRRVDTVKFNVDVALGIHPTANREGYRYQQSVPVALRNLMFWR